MKPWLEWRKVPPGGAEAMLGVGKYVRLSGLEPSLINLIDVRASKINGCAWCLDMHTKDARAAGESEQRLYAISAWRETPFYTAKERAALAWTEAVTLVSEGHVPDGVYWEALKNFTKKELVDLTLAVIVINGWNRLSVAFKTVPGDYQPRQHVARARAP